MFEAKKSANEQVTRKMSKRSVIIIAILCVLLATCCIGGGVKVVQTLTSKGFDNTSVSIIELDTIDALRAIPEAEVKSAKSTLYKVGDSYYSYFPSTGKLELVTKVLDYDTKSLTLLGNMLGDVKTADANETITAKVETMEVFGSALNDRQQYIQHELDNCNANLLLSSNNVNLMTYKEQLESELQQLTEYRVTVAEQMQLILTCLNSDAADKLLAEKISAIIDENYVKIVNRYAATKSDTDMNAVLKMLKVQEETIQTLTDKYTEIEEILISKRATLEIGVESVNNTELNSMIDVIDTRINTYISDCMEQINDLNVKVKALENLYTSINGVSGTNGTNGNDGTNGSNDLVVSAIRQQYKSVVDEQIALQDRITYLEGLLGQSGTKNNSATKTDGTDGTVGSNTGVITETDGVYAALETELANLKAQNEAIDELLNTTDLASIDTLAAEQERIQGLIETLESAMAESDSLVSEEQDARREELNEVLQALIESTASELTNNINDLTNSTSNANESLQSELENSKNDLEQKQSEMDDRLRELIETTANTLQDANTMVDEKLQALQDVYSAYVDATDLTISGIDMRLEVAENLLITQGTDISALQDAKDLLNADLAVLRVDLAKATEDLSATITEKYEELLEKAQETANKVSVLENTTILGMQGDISKLQTNLQTSVETITNQITNITERLQALETKTLPIASRTTLGGVKVDGDMLKVDGTGLLSFTPEINTLLSNLKNSGTGTTNADGTLTIDLGGCKLVFGTVKLNFYFSGRVGTSDLPQGRGYVDGCSGGVYLRDVNQIHYVGIQPQLVTKNIGYISFIISAYGVSCSGSDLYINAYSPHFGEDIGSYEATKTPVDPIVLQYFAIVT